MKPWIQLCLHQTQPRTIEMDPQLPPPLEGWANQWQSWPTSAPNRTTAALILQQFHIATENGPFTNDLLMHHGDSP